MPNYQNGKIYKIVNTEGTLTYIGSTCQSLAQRKAKHHESYKYWKNGITNYVTAFKLFDDDEEGCQIVLLEAFPCNNRNELEKRERYYIENNNCVNKIRPTRTKQEWIEENKEKHQQYQKQYREDNKDKNREYQKQYRADNNVEIQQFKNDKHKCECGGNYTTSHKAKHIKTFKHLNYLNLVKPQ
jgi:hypothetical protein